MNEALEFHDSTVRCVEQHGSCVFVEFEPGAIHRTGAGPGIDDGDVFPMTTRLRLGIALLLVVAAVAAAGIWLAREVSIDKCLDRGGAWEHERARCLVAAR